MKGPERRLTPRTKVERFAYINIEPNNGGSVLNVSEEGLCFQTIAPVQRVRTIRFWFSEHNQRIEVDGELAWTDETQKRGGLRFTVLPVDAREPIRKWISHPTTSFVADETSGPSVAPQRTFPNLSASRMDTKAVPVLPETRLPTRLSGFSGGLATGLLVSALVAAPLLFHTYRRQFGESLIQLGERFAARQATTQTVSPAPQTLLPPGTVAPAPSPIPVPRPEKLLPQALANPAKPQQAKLEPTGAPASTMSPAPQTVLPAPRAVSPLIPVPRPEKLLPQALANPAKPQQAKLEAAGPASATPTPAGGPATKDSATFRGPAISPMPPISLPTTAVAVDSRLNPSKLSTVPQLETANHPTGHAKDSRERDGGPTSEMYFEVDRLKDELWAHKATDKLAQLGFHASVIQKGHLWRNSYYVLVGPYRDDDAAEAAHKNLVSRGFKPRSFKRGSRDFTLHSELILNGTHMPVGDCTISWESYTSDATVKFVQDNYVVATVSGKWLKRGVRYERDAYVYWKNGDGSRTLLEIQFAGMSEVLVFGKPF
jgi:hypothetical protein